MAHRAPVELALALVVRAAVTLGLASAPAGRTAVSTDVGTATVGLASAPARRTVVLGARFVARGR